MAEKDKKKGKLEVRLLDVGNIGEFPDLKKRYGESLREWYISNVLVVLHDGKVIFDASDGFEPEDAKFDRDLWWITDIIQTAYKKGLEDGLKEGC